MKNEEVCSEYTPVEQKEDKKHKNDPMETTSTSKLLQNNHKLQNVQKPVHFSYF